MITDSITTEINYPEKNWKTSRSLVIGESRGPGHVQVRSLDKTTIMALTWSRRLFLDAFEKSRARASEKSGIQVVAGQEEASVARSLAGKARQGTNESSGAVI